MQEQLCNLLLSRHEGTVAVFSGVSVGGLISFGIGRNFSHCRHDRRNCLDRVVCLWRQ